MVLPLTTQERAMRLSQFFPCAALITLACWSAWGANPHETLREKGEFPDPMLEIQNQTESEIFPHQFITGTADSLAPSEHIENEDEQSLDDNIEKIIKAAEITAAAQLAAATMKVGMYERDIKKLIQDTYDTMGAEGLAFSHIVGSGPNSCDLHYSGDKRQLQENDLVVIDIGAKWSGMCADITRTFPASGKFTERQREVYQLVLDAKNAAAAQIKQNTTLQSLTGWVKQFMRKSPLRAKDAQGRERTMDVFFTHSLSHYLGAKVHDGGNTKAPIPVGRAFTIEPGIYIKSEGFGIRIEDDYVMTKEGAVNLIKGLPETVEEIEALMAK